MKHDPRTSPRPGDRTRKDDWLRQVEMCNGARVEFTIPPLRYRHSIPLSSWQHLNEGAEVIHCAD